MAEFSVPMNLQIQFKRFPIIFWLGLTFISVWIFTARSIFDSPDGDKLYFYGFPSPWFRWSQVSSMEYEVNILNLTKNLVLNGFLLAAALLLIRSFVPTVPKYLKRLGQITGVLMLGLATLILIIYGTYFNFDREFPDSNWKFRSSSPYFGLERKYQPEQ